MGKVAFVQSASVLHWWVGGPSKAELLFAQPPQPAKTWLPPLPPEAAPFDWVAVLRLKPIARPPSDGGLGRQSWLVGNAGPSVADPLVPGVQGMPSSTPPLQRCVVSLQIGHGWMAASVTQAPVPQFVLLRHARP